MRISSFLALAGAGLAACGGSDLVLPNEGVAARIDIVSGEVQSGDLFLLGSDGLTRMVDDHELAAELTSNNLDNAADRLIDMVLARGAPDNVTLIITRYV